VVDEKIGTERRKRRLKAERTNRENRWSRDLIKEDRREDDDKRDIRDKEMTEEIERGQKN
jgi:hypothetical protein